MQGTALRQASAGISGADSSANVWDVNSTGNFSGAKYIEGDAVNFTDTTFQGGAVTTTNVVIAAGGVKPSKVTFWQLVGEGLHHFKRRRRHGGN